MKRCFYILLTCLSLPIFALAAKKEAATEIYLSPEEQCFRYYLYDAQRALEQDDYVRAVASYLFLVRQNPSDATAQQNLGVIYQAIGEKEWALQHYAIAYQNDPISYWENYALLLYEKDPKSAIRILERTQKSLPEDRDLLEALVNAYSYQAMWKKAIRIQEYICYLDGLTPYTVMPLYRLYVSSGQSKKALQLLDEYLDENTEDYRFQAFRGDVWLSLGEEEQALRLYYTEEQRHPDNPYVLLSLADYSIRTNDTTQCKNYILKALRSDAWSVEQKIQTLQNAGKWFAQQKGLMEQMLQELAEAYPLSEQVYDAQDKYYSAKGDYVKAAEALRQMTDINPNNPHTWGRWLQVLQSDTTAQDNNYEYVIRKGYQYKGNDHQWYYWMAALLVTKQEMDSAIVIAEEGIQLTVSTADDTRYRFMMLSLLGDMYLDKGDLENCYRVYDEALLLAPENAYILNNYAYTLSVNNGDLRKAERMSRKTIEKEPDNATFLDTYAWILHLQGQDFLAEFYIKKAMENQVTGKEDPILKEHYDIITQK